MTATFFETIAKEIETMKIRMTTAMLALGLSFSVAGYGQDDTEAPEDEMDGAETLLMLPENASEQGVLNSQFGIDTANSAREQANQARDRNRPEMPQARGNGMPDIPAADDRSGRPQR
jgi:hypothetical protein